jgi:hypothetical protein
VGILVSCGEKKIPDTILKQKQMTDIISDVLIADAVVNESRNRDTSLSVKSLSNAYYQKIFSLHKINKEIFLRSYDYYIEHPALFKEVLDSANSLIAKKIMSEPVRPEKK